MKTLVPSLSLVVCAGLLASVFGLTGCASDPQRSTGRRLDDSRITSKVKGALNSSPIYKFPYVKVATYNGVVQLSGFVNKDEQKAEATQIAKAVRGVDEVINNVSLAPAAMGGVSGREPAGVTTGRDTTPHDTTVRDTNGAPVAPRNP